VIPHLSPILLRKVPYNHTRDQKDLTHNHYPDVECPPIRPNSEVSSRRGTRLYGATRDYTRDFVVFAEDHCLSKPTSADEGKDGANTRREASFEGFVFFYLGVFVASRIEAFLRPCAPSHGRPRRSFGRGGRSGRLAHKSDAACSSFHPNSHMLTATTCLVVFPACIFWFCVHE